MSYRGSKDYRYDRDNRSYRSRRSSSPARKRSRHYYDSNESNDRSKYRNSHKQEDTRKNKSQVLNEEDTRKNKSQVLNEALKKSESSSTDIPKEQELEEQRKKQQEEEEFRRKVESQLQNMQNDEEEEIRKARERRLKRMQELALNQNTNEKANTPTSTTVRSDISPNPKQPNSNPESPTSWSSDEEIPPQLASKQNERQLFLQQLEKERNRRDEEHKDQAPPQQSVHDEDEGFDMFSDKELTAPNTVMYGPRLSAHQLAQSDNPHLSANWNDDEGYYCFRTGEILQEKYRVLGFHGKGVFGSVLKAVDIETNQDLAIKVIRNNEWMKKCGLREIDLLNKLNKSDPDDKCHCVRAITHFEFRNHLCIVFEALDMDLRNVLKKYGKEQGKQVGISLKAVQLYAKQLFVALLHLQTHQILHADIKPDNILVNQKRTIVKLCDFGSASDANENVITPYLVSRFYRAPEIVLGMRYSYAIDIWSVGCSLYELYIGEILFPSSNNNDLLYQVQQIKGPFSSKMLKKCLFREKYFDVSGAFMYKKEDPVTKQLLIKRIPVVNKVRDIKTILMKADDGENRKKIIQFADLLERCLTLDPAKRITVNEALEHAFLSS
jgi:serine/threonine-protein kinase PRP4